MEFKFYYNELYPRFNSYKKLITEMQKMSKDFFDVDKVFYKDYNYNLMKRYEIKKRKIINKMFRKIISYFPQLNNIPCAIYINGSYARKSITANSDMDLTFYFNKEDISKYQSTIYLIRYAIATMFNVNIVHVHSFTKNFTTDYRKKNNLVISDQYLSTKIIWTLSNKSYNICYPENQMLPEREMCEISSIKDIDSLKQLFEKQLRSFHPKEWIYTHECIHITNEKILIDKLIKRLDNMYNKEERKIALNKIRNEIEELLSSIKVYYNELYNCDEIELADYNMIGKRKVTALVHAFATYLRWYYIDNGLENIPLYLNLDTIFNYKNELIDQKNIDKINQSYCYFRYLISRIEIWTKKYNHHFEHRSKEKVKKEVLNNQYINLWGKKYLPINEQVNAFMKLSKSIEDTLEKMV